jgi:hypothetical protein
MDGSATMTAPLRRRHLQIWLMLALALPALFVAALAARRDNSPRNSRVSWEQVR